MSVRNNPDAPPTYAGTYTATRLADERMTDLLHLSAQTKWSRRNAADPADRYDDDVRTVRSRIARELMRRNDLRRRHPSPPQGSTIVILEEPVDWPFPACEVAPKAGTTGTVVAYGELATSPRRYAWRNRIARRFYALIRMGDDFDHAPGSTFPVPVWQVAATS